MKNDLYAKHNFQDRVPNSQIIGGVSTYPADDRKKISHVSLLSRDFVDRFVAQHKTRSAKDVFARCIARRLTSRSIGTTIQNINMLDLLLKAVVGEDIDADTPLFIGESITEAILMAEAV